MTKFITRFAQDESGATAIEYGLIAALVGVAIVAGAGVLGDQIDATFADVAKKMKDALL